MTSNQNIVGVDKPVRVLISVSADAEADYKWFAVALEMDVWGFGNTEQEALIDLEELVSTQIEFATGRKEYDMLDHPADDKWFKLWDEVEKSKADHIQKICKTIPADEPLGKVSLEYLFQEVA